jgi:hypothetical protein
VGDCAEIEATPDGIRALAAALRRRPESFIVGHDGSRVSLRCTDSASRVVVSFERPKRLDIVGPPALLDVFAGNVEFESDRAGAYQHVEYFRGNVGVG